MNICIVAGARPNFIKVAPIVHAVDRARRQGSDIDYRLVYAGADADPTLEDSLFDDLQIPRPDSFLGVDSKSLNEITGRVMGEFERYLGQYPADVVIVVDDLASTMAAAIVTKKQGIRLAHLVAGTRSFDINMPKEINRLVIDGLSDLLFTAGDGAFNIVTREGASLSQIYKVGNILMDTLRHNRNRWQRPDVVDELALEEGRYIVFTLNRKALIANRDNLAAMIGSMVTAAHGVPIVAPLRGVARQSVEEILQSSAYRPERGCAADTLNPPSSALLPLAPMSYLEFGWLTAHAMGVVTDSGNVAEEATFNSVPCITLNSYTEHIETVRVGSNVLVGEDPQLLADAVADMTEGRWKKSSIPERWDGRTADRIVQILLNDSER